MLGLSPQNVFLREDNGVTDGLDFKSEIQIEHKGIPGKTVGVTGVMASKYTLLGF